MEVLVVCSVGAGICIGFVLGIITATTAFLKS